METLDMYKTVIIENSKHFDGKKLARRYTPA